MSNLYRRGFNFFYRRIRNLHYYVLSEIKINFNNIVRLQPVLANGLGAIDIKKGVVFGTLKSPNLYTSYCYLEARHNNAKIIIGENTWINNSLSIICEKSTIDIGSNCRIGGNVTILDSDFHHLNYLIRDSGEHQALPIKIGNNVFIGNNVTILKGVVIEDNSVIANGSIVTKNIPKNTIAAGSPAKIIKKINL